MIVKYTENLVDFFDIISLVFNSHFEFDSNRHSYHSPCRYYFGI